MPYRQITLEERYHLASLRAVGARPAAIVRALGRHPSTIRRELGRNRTLGGPYRPYPADCYARTRRSHARRNQRLTAADWRRVVRYLRQDWSPEEIAGRGRRVGTLRISHEKSIAICGTTARPAASSAACCAAPASSAVAAWGASVGGALDWGARSASGRRT